MKADLQPLVGREITERCVINTGASKPIRRKQKWFVIEAYPHFIRVMRYTENGVALYNTFSTGDLVTMGIIKAGGRAIYERQKINP